MRILIDEKLSSLRLAARLLGLRWLVLIHKCLQGDSIGDKNANSGGFNGPHRGL